MKKSVRARHKIKSKKSVLKQSAFRKIILFLLLGGVIIYFLLFFDKFQIKKIIIFDNEKISGKEVENLIWEKTQKRIVFLASQSIFLINPTEISDAIIKEFPVVSHVKVKRRLPDSVIINIKERQPFLVFCQAKMEADDCFFMDEKGVVFERVDRFFPGFSIVRQDEEINVILGKEVVSGELIRHIGAIQRSLKDDFNVFVETARIISDTKMDIVTNEKWEIYINPSSDFDMQVIKLKLVLDGEYPEGSRTGLKYIDLRYDRVYVCEIGSPCANE